jgi:hypothetical protein
MEVGMNDMVGAKITDEIPPNFMMISNKLIMPNDIEMIIEAWKIAQKQRYYDAERIGYEKSKVIRQERIDSCYRRNAKKVY